MTQEHDTEFSDASDLGPSDEEPTTGGKKQLPFWLELPLLIGIALIVAVVIKTFLFQAFYIPSSSMENTLQINDRVLVNKVTYEIGDISRKDVIVFDDPRGGFEQPDEDAIDSAVRNLLESIGLATPQSEFIKRVIGVPGDVVEASSGDLIVNGEAQDEPYRKNPERPIPDFAPVVVPEGHLFVMGDNRGASQDSRFFGPIPIDTVVGKAFVIIWPPSRWSGI
ncbi:MAG: signal peptidase I [Actinomycetia bacterium]|nr:signal peptidase I [Actinomycetes bacterium]